MSKQQEALRLALEALKELRMLGMNAQWHDSWLAKPNEAIAAIREALAEQPAQQEPVAWRNAALRVGEDLSSVGPNGYYDMTAEQWLDWAMAQEPRGKTSLDAPPASKPWVGLVWGELPEDGHNHDFLRGAAWAESKLREKNE